MNIQFDGAVIDVRPVDVYVSHAKIGDILVGPNNRLLRVVTVQTDCPRIDSNRPFTAILVETEDHTKIPLNGLAGKVHFLRPRKVH